MEKIFYNGYTIVAVDKPFIVVDDSSGYEIEEECFCYVIPKKPSTSNCTKFFCTIDDAKEGIDSNSIETKWEEWEF
jgi:hypothetical protein